MSIFKMIENERQGFYGCIGDGVPISEAYRMSRCFDERLLVDVMDRGEIVKYWLNHDYDYNMYPHADYPLFSLDDARKAVVHIDDGRIGWSTKPEFHPVWYTPITFSGIQ